MAYPYEFYLKRANRNLSTGRDSLKLCLFIKIKFLKFLLNKTKGKRCSIYRRFYVPQDKRHSACMVLVAVCYEKGLNFLSVFSKVGYVRDDYVYSEHIIFRKHQAAIYDNYSIIIFHNHHIQAYFAKTAKRNNAEWILPISIVH